MKQYEAVFVLNDQKCDDNGESFVTQTVKDQIEKLGGTLLETESMGRRQLAHPIKKRHTGTYWDLTIEMPEDQVAPFRNLWRLDEHVLRMEIFIDERPEPSEEDEEAEDEE